MPYIILVFAYRKPGLSPADFKAHYENCHVPLLQSLAGDTFPNSHVRRYIQRSENKSTSAPEAHSGNNVNTPAAVLVGTQADFEYDAFAELTFDDEAAFQAFFARVGQGKAAEKIAEDEEKFLDRGKMRVVVVRECIVTNNVF